MAEFYKLLKADPMGEPWQAHGKDMQTYWCQVEGEELNVMITKQVGNTISPGHHVYGNLMKATSQKGNDYWKFKSEQVPEGVQRPQDAPSTPAQATAQQATGDVTPGWFSGWGNLLMEMAKDIKELKGEESPNSIKMEDIPTGKKEVEQTAGKPLAPEDKEMLDGIFGGEPEPEV